MHLAWRDEEYHRKIETTKQSQMEMLEMKTTVLKIPHGLIADWMQQGKGQWVNLKSSQ